MVRLFPKANLMSEEPTLTDPEMMKNRSKVVQHIKELSKAGMDPDKSIKPEEYVYLTDAQGKKTIDVWTKTKVIWQSIEEEKKKVFKQTNNKPLTTLSNLTNICSQINLNSQPTFDGQSSYNPQTLSHKTINFGKLLTTKSSNNLLQTMNPNSA